MLSIAVIMVWLVVVVVLYMTHLGFDVRSRGFEARGLVAATLPELGITIGQYYKKRNDHPVVHDDLATRSKVFLALTLVTSVAVVVMAVFLFLL